MAQIHARPENEEQKKWAGPSLVGIYKQQSRDAHPLFRSHALPFIYFPFFVESFSFRWINICVISELRNRILFSFHVTICVYTFPSFFRTFENGHN